MKHSPFSFFVYYTAQILIAGIFLIGVLFIVVDVGKNLDIDAFRKMHIGYGHGIAILYVTIASGYIVFASIFQNRLRLKRIGLSSLIALLTFGISQYVLLH